MSYPPAEHILSRDTTMEIGPELKQPQIPRNMKPTHENAPTNSRSIFVEGIHLSLGGDIMKVQNTS